LSPPLRGCYMLRIGSIAPLRDRAFKMRVFQVHESILIE